MEADEDLDSDEKEERRDRISKKLKKGGVGERKVEPSEEERGKKTSRR